MSVAEKQVSLFFCCRHFFLEGIYLMEKERDERNLTAEAAEDASGEYDFAGGEKAADKQKTIRFLVAVAALIVCAFFIFTDMEDEEGYLIKIPTDEGYTWEITDYDEDLLTMKKDMTEEDGKYKAVFTGLAEGDAEIHTIRYADGDSANVVEARTYKVKVLEDGTVLYRSIERNLTED